jgi:hypothetical protein
MLFPSSSTFYLAVSLALSTMSLVYSVCLFSYYPQASDIVKTYRLVLGTANPSQLIVLNYSHSGHYTTCATEKARLKKLRNKQQKTALSLSLHNCHLTPDEDTTENDGTNYFHATACQFANRCRALQFNTQNAC